MASCTFRLLQLGSILVLFISLLIGTLTSGIARRLGIFRWMAYKSNDDFYKGMTPAFLEDVPNLYNYTTFSTKSNLTHKRAIVTGANNGLGYWASHHLAMQGAHVIMACRNEVKCETAASNITAALLSSEKSRLYPGGSVETMTLDTSSVSVAGAFASSFTKKYPGPLDLLLLNAGIGIPGALNAGFGAKQNPNDVSVDGIELVFATNHVGHQLIYELLLPQLLMSGETNKDGSRVVVTSSCANYLAPPWGLKLDKDDILNISKRYQYEQSKLANILFAQEATRRLDVMNTKAALNVYVNSVHPGAVNTNIWTAVKQYLSDKGFIGSIFIKIIEFNQDNLIFTSEEGALNLLYLAGAPEVAEQQIRGKYFHSFAMEAEPHPITKNLTLQAGLWDFTDKLIKVAQLNIEVRLG